jgi:hypothetical protein
MNGLIALLNGDCLAVLTLWQSILKSLRYSLLSTSSQCSGIMHAFFFFFFFFFGGTGSPYFLFCFSPSAGDGDGTQGLMSTSLTVTIPSPLSNVLFIYVFIYLVVLEFEFRALWLLENHSNTWATPPSTKVFVLVFNVSKKIQESRNHNPWAVQCLT